MDPNNLSVKDVLITLAPIFALLAGLVFLYKGMKLAAGIVLIPLAILFVYGGVKTPWKRIAQIEYEKEQIQMQSVGGRVWLFIKRFFDYLGILLLVVFVVTSCFSIYVRFFSNGS